MTCGSHEEIQSVHSWSFWLFLVKVWRAYLKSFFPHPVKIPIPETTISSRGHLKLTAAKARLEQGMLLGHSEQRWFLQGMKMLIMLCPQLHLEPNQQLPGEHMAFPNWDTVSSSARESRAASAAACSC